MLRERSKTRAYVAALVAILACGGLPAASAVERPLARGTAILDPLALRELDLRETQVDGLANVGFGIGHILAPYRTSIGPMRNDALFALPSFAPLRGAIDKEFDRYIAGHRAEISHDKGDTDRSSDLQIFDRDQLYSHDTRFVLAGIVNRMDRAFVSPSGCGEIRLIYRLTRMGPVAASKPRRLPMTLMLVMKAKGDSSIGASGAEISCAEIARRWLATADEQSTGSALAVRLMSPSGPLALVKPEDLEQIETNIQIGHISKSETHGFRADYLMNVFRRDPVSGRFVEAPLENQIDRDRLVADSKLAAEFRDWLLQPEHLRELDRGTIVVPEKFLTTDAIDRTPVGFARSDRQPMFGLVHHDLDRTGGVFQPEDVVAALERAASQGIAFENIRSVAGFERRLNDIGCAGCHQTRGIGGFHVAGVDWMAERPSNERIVPGSPHFFGDQVRRRDILAAIRDGRPPDYSRGFSSRPQLRGSRELLGTEYYDGWGAHCYQVLPAPATNDRSFASWTCAQGLACQVIDGSHGRSERMGMCFVSKR